MSMDTARQIFLLSSFRQSQFERFRFCDFRNKHK